MNLDEIDIVILSNLQNSGRMTNVELAKRAGISAPPCLRRLKILEEERVVTGYHAVINSEFMGFTIKAFCIVSLVSQSSQVVNDFLRIIGIERNIRTCFSTSGSEFFILTIVARNLREYEKILRDTLQGSGIVSNITNYIILNKHKDKFGIPIDNSLCK